jgi:hypothetical protein
MTIEMVELSCHFRSVLSVAANSKRNRIVTMDLIGCSYVHTAVQHGRG